MLHNTTKDLSDFTNFPGNMVLFGVQKKKLHSWTTLKANVCIFRYTVSPLEKFYSRETVRFSLIGRGLEERLNNLFEAAVCLGLAKYFTWNEPCEIFEIQLFFSISKLPSKALKRWNFPYNLDFKGKIVTKYLIRSYFLSTKNNMNKKLQIKHGAIQKYVTCVMPFFHPFNFVILCQFYSIISPVLFTKLH